MADNGQMTSQDALANLAPGAVAELAHIRALMEGLLATERYDILQIVTGDFDRREAVLADSPGTRSKRLIIPRPGLGQDGTLLAAVASVPVELIEQNEGRLGGLIVNYGASGCFLYLATLGAITNAGQRANKPALWLAAGGGSWDFRLGNVLYGGTVCALVPAGSTNLTVAEF